MKVVSWQSSSVQNGKGLRYWQAKHSCSSQQFIDMTDWFPFQGTTTTYLDQIVSGKKYLVVQYPSLSAGGTFWDPCWDNMGKGRLEKCCKQFSLLISNLLFLTSVRHAPSYQKTIERNDETPAFDRFLLNSVLNTRRRNNKKTFLQFRQCQKTR